MSWSPVSRSERPRCDASWYSSKWKCCPFHVLFDLLLYFSYDLWSQIASSKPWETHIHTHAQVFSSFPDSFFLCVLCPADEREDVQKKTFTKWVNSQLTKVRYHYFIKSSLWSHAEHFHLAVILTSRHEPGFHLNVKGILRKVAIKQRRNAN